MSKEKSLYSYRYRMLKIRRQVGKNAGSSRVRYQVSKVETRQNNKKSEGYAA